jgi:hypothetical protein
VVNSGKVKPPKALNPKAIREGSSRTLPNLSLHNSIRVSRQAERRQTNFVSSRKCWVTAINAYRLISPAALLGSNGNCIIAVLRSQKSRRNRTKSSGGSKEFQYSLKVLTSMLITTGNTSVVQLDKTERMMLTANANPAKALLTPLDHILILIDFQSQMAFATKSIDAITLRNNAGLSRSEIRHLVSASLRSNKASGHPHNFNVK